MSTVENCFRLKIKDKGNQGKKVLKNPTRSYRHINEMNTKTERIPVQLFEERYYNDKTIA
jgi:hypothetical protein